MKEEKVLANYLVIKFKIDHVSHVFIQNEVCVHAHYHFALFNKANSRSKESCLLC